MKKYLVAIQNEDSLLISDVSTFFVEAEDEDQVWKVIKELPCYKRGTKDEYDWKFSFLVEPVKTGLSLEEFNTQVATLTEEQI